MAESCGYRALVRDDEGNMLEVPISDIGREGHDANSTPGIGGTEVVKWTERARETSTVTVDGVTIERIDKIQFDTPSGPVELEFKN